MKTCGKPELTISTVNINSGSAQVKTEHSLTINPQEFFNDLLHFIYVCLSLFESYFFNILDLGTCIPSIDFIKQVFSLCRYTVC